MRPAFKGAQIDHWEDIELGISAGPGQKTDIPSESNGLPFPFRFRTLSNGRE